MTVKGYKNAHAKKISAKLTATIGFLPQFSPFYYRKYYFRHSAGHFRPMADSLRQSAG